MIETLCFRNQVKKYIVSVQNRILIVTHNHTYAKRIERIIIENHITNNDNLTVGTQGDEK